MIITVTRDTTSSASNSVKNEQEIDGLMKALRVHSYIQDDI